MSDDTHDWKPLMAEVPMTYTDKARKIVESEFPERRANGFSIQVVTQALRSEYERGRESVAKEEENYKEAFHTCCERLQLICGRLGIIAGQHRLDFLDDFSRKYAASAIRNKDQKAG